MYLNPQNEPENQTLGKCSNHLVHTLNKYSYILFENAITCIQANISKCDCFSSTPS